MIRLGLIGHPVDHSRSPELHTAALRAGGLEGCYTCHDVLPGTARTAVLDLWRQQYTGLNVTLPLKVEALKLCDELSPVARRVGAVNTLYRRKDGTVYGTNTDVVGGIGALSARGLELEGARVLILGAGGAARGIAVGLLDAGVSSLILTNRTGSRAQRMQMDLEDTRVKAVSLSASALQLVRPTLVVNATSIGLSTGSVHRQEAMRWFERLPFAAWGECFGYDLIYSTISDQGLEGWTPFLSVVKSHGGRTLDGWDMLRRQAAESFGLWTQTEPTMAYEAMETVSRV